MALKAYKPTSAGRRFQTVLDFSDLTKKKPEKSLLVSLAKTGGRNSAGRITSRYIGGGHKQKYRRVDFKREKLEIPARVAAIEYDPNRSANIALLHYRDGEKRYILAPVDLKVGDTLLAGERVDIRPGNALPLKNIPLGTQIHNLEVKKGKGGQLVRSAGSSGQLMAKEGKLRPREDALRRSPADPCGLLRHRSARWATWIMKTCPWARPGGNDGWGAAPMCAAWS